MSLLKKSCAFIGLCNPICMAILVATELNVTDGSFHVDFVGNGHVHATSIACTDATVYGGFDISAHIALDTGVDKAVSKVMSSRYRRDAALIMAQKRQGLNLWYSSGRCAGSKKGRT